MAAVKPPPSQQQPLDTEVAAVKPPRRPKNKSQRGGGGENSSKPQSNQSQAQPSGNKGPRHATAKGDSEKLCRIHYKWGENGSYCAAPWKCPMKSVFKAPQ